jgi:hypothetical protein
MRISFGVLAFAAALTVAPPGAAPLGAQPAPAAATADTVPSLRWRLLARRLGREAAQARRAAQQAAAAGDSSALRALPRTMMMPLRANALLMAAQYQATDSARVEPGRPSLRVAIAAASATMMREVLPQLAPEIDREIARDSVAERQAGVSAARVAAGARIGRAVARSVTEWAKADGSDARWAGTVPTGPGMWRSAAGAAPFQAAAALRRPWVLDSMSQFRPKPPPAYDSPEFVAALDEVRRVARERTPEQTLIARHWVEGGVDWWMEAATDLLLRHRASNDVALRMLTVMAVGGYDLFGACWDAKYHYWVLRPTHADSSIAIVEGMALPNFPAYPSGHACNAGFASTVIAHFLPAAREEVMAMAEENALSRLYAGVHYRFDNDVGLELGRRVARHVIEREERGAWRGRWRTTSTTAAGSRR